MPEPQPPSSPPAAPTSPDAPGVAGPGGKRGRRLASVAYYLVAGAVAAMATVQLTRQIFFSREGALNLAPSECLDAERRLYEALSRGRETADVAAASGDPELALAAFRAEVEPAWRGHERIREVCAHDPRLVRALDALERLRYAEEHGLRTHTTEVVAARRLVRELLGDDRVPAAPQRPPSPPSR